MRIKPRLSRRSAAVAGAALAAGAAVLAVGTPASAAISNHRVQLCAQGNYAADITWSTGSSTRVVFPGQCQTFDIVGTGPYTIGGFYNVSKAHFKLVTVLPLPGGFNSSTPGSKWGAEGDTGDPNNPPYVVRWQ
ncbi:hypothetical protein ABZ719_17060 [Streptomyces sp. NPDC006743]|uniref:hypothetical protein n=1 Tax=Streptomyces sp. NPDC006743 TaxID=3154480 RepID=UPI003454B307